MKAPLSILRAIRRSKAAFVGLCLAVSSASLLGGTPSIEIFVNTADLGLPQTINFSPGDSASIEMLLTGTAPWTVVWSDSYTQTVTKADSVPQLNGQPTLAWRQVSPTISTTYTITSLSDANGTAASSDISGSATVNPYTPSFTTVSPPTARMTSAVQLSPPQVTLTFTGLGAFNLYRRAYGTTDWGSPIAAVSTSTYQDTSVTVGSAYEYRAGETINLENNNYAIGSLNLPPVHSRGKVILLVDKTQLSSSDFVTALGAFEQDLIGDGWTIVRHDVARGPEYPQAGQPLTITMPQGSVINGIQFRGAAPLINVDFTSATTSTKTGAAATGLGANDFWNTFTAASGNTTVANLVTSDGRTTDASISASLDQASTVGSSDPMFNTYLSSSATGNSTITVNNLPQGVYDIYIYGHGSANSQNGTFTASSADDSYNYPSGPTHSQGVNSSSRTYPQAATTTSSGWNTTAWTEGQQYVVLRNVEIRPPIPIPVPGHSGLEQTWVDANKTAVGEIKAIIKADYAADPSNVKAVCLLGHIAIPYSGNSRGVNGGHYDGAEPADAYYGDVISPVSSITGFGWTDFSADNQSEFFYGYPQSSPDANQVIFGAEGVPVEAMNVPGDGKFDNDFFPAQLQLQVGRVDLYNMSGFAGDWVGIPVPATFTPKTETQLLVQYLAKDHQFRQRIINVPRKAFVENFDLGTLTSGFFSIFDSSDVLTDNGNLRWFRCLDTNAFLWASGGGHGGFEGGQSLGTTRPAPDTADNGLHDSFENNYVTQQANAVFVNLYGSFFGVWDHLNDFLRAPLANDGYGLGSIFNTATTTPDVLSTMAIGGTVGDSILRLENRASTSVNHALMGDPTLRLHMLAPPSALTLTPGSGGAVSLSWTASADASSGSFQGYYVYGATSPSGSFTLLNPSAPITGTSYSYTPTTPTYTTFMVKADNLESSPSGTYYNLSQGVINSVSSSGVAPTITAQPVSKSVLPGGNAAFTVTAEGTSTLTYQWYKGSTSISGATQNVYVINNVTTGDVGDYTVVVANSAGSVTSSPAAHLSVLGPPIANAISFTVSRDSAAANHDIITGDSDTDTSVPNSALTYATLLNLPAAQQGTVVAQSDHRNVSFTPGLHFVGTTSFTKVVTDGAGFASATVTFNVAPLSGSAPTLSGFSDQTSTEDTVIHIPFTVTDPNTPLQNLAFTYSVSSANSSLISTGNITVTWDGATPPNPTLNIKLGTHQVGTGTVTVTVTDYDLRTASASFQVTSTPTTAPTLLATGFSGSSFQFTINGPAGATTQILFSDDMVSWSYLGEITLNGNIYNYTDTSITTQTHRFYLARNDNGSSANIIGFIKKTIPVKTGSQSGEAYVVNQLNNPQGNTLDKFLVSGPTGVMFSKWNGTQFDSTTYHTFTPHWTQILTLNPGDTAVIVNGSTTTPFTITFIGDVPAGTQAITSFPATAGYLGSIFPVANTLDVLGFSGVAGDQVEQWDIGTQAAVNSTLTSAGPPPVWSPSSPNLGFGEAFKLTSGGSGSRSWSVTFPAITTQPQSQTINEGSSVTFSVTATGTGPLSYQWQFNNVNISGATSSSYTKGAVTIADAGRYSVVVSGPAGSTVSSLASLTVTPAQTPIVSGGTYVADTSFSFTVVGPPGAHSEIYSSTDLVTWSPAGGVTLSSSGTGTFTDTQVNGVSYRFYRAGTGGNCSQAIGFTRVTIPGSGGSKLIANQLDASPNTLPSLFGTSLPDNTVIKKWDGTQFVDYTWSASSSSWSPNANSVTLAPGEGAFLVNNSGSSYTQTFVGLVKESSLSTSVASGNYLYSSQVPKSGGLTSVLGYSATVGDHILTWSGTAYNTKIRVSFGSGWSPSGEPTIGVGEAFFIQTSTAQTWSTSFSACSGTPTCTAPVLSSAGAPTSSFTFNATGAPGSYWNIYSSTDLVNWTLAGGVTLSSSGTGSFTDSTVTSVNYKFYRAGSDGCCSQAIGFTRVTIPGSGGSKLIANQLDNSPNTLPSLFGTSLPDNTVIQKWDGTQFVNYTWSASSSSWSPNANSVTLAPGEGAFLVNNSSSSYTQAFVGLVKESSLSTSVASGNYLYSSQVPKSGGLTTVLGYSATVGDHILTWSGTGYNTKIRVSFGSGWSPSGEPTIGVGEAFFIQTSTAQTWSTTFSACSGTPTCTAPVLSSAGAPTSSFTFNATGAPGSYWNIYSSTDLVTWSLAGGVTLSSSGTGSFTDSQVSGVSYRFYRAGSSGCCSQAIGFTRVTVPGNGGSKLIANQLDASPNTLPSLFGTSLPDNTVIMKWDGTQLVNYTWTASSSSWSPSATSVTLAPGEGAFLVNNSANPYTATFVGLVKEGSLSTSVASGNYIYSSQVPKAGGLTTVLGYSATVGDHILTWSGTAYNTKIRVSFGSGWSPSGEPTIGVGEAFFIQTSTAQTWGVTFTACQ